jgi:hypothetical protein
VPLATTSTSASTAPGMATVSSTTRMLSSKEIRESKRAREQVARLVRAQLCMLYKENRESKRAKEQVARAVRAQARFTASLSACVAYGLK